VKPTLGQIFGLSLLRLVLILAVLFYIVFRGSRETIMESSYRIRDEASREIDERVTNFLSRALNARDPEALEPGETVFVAGDLGDKFISSSKAT
jgi:hypothetical protein